MAFRQLTDKLVSGEIPLSGIKLGGAGQGNVVLTQDQVNFRISEAIDEIVAGDMTWMGEYVPETSYGVKEVVRDGDWLMIANKTTTDRPAPQPVGDPTYLYSGTGFVLNQDTGVSQIVCGTRYYAAEPFWMNGYRINTIAGNHYEVITVRNPGVTDEVNFVNSFVASTEGWREFGLITKLYPAGTTFDLLVIVSQPDPAPVETVANYNYVASQSGGTPATGQITQAINKPNELLVHVVDSDAIDRQSMLLLVNVGDTISLGGTVWAVQSKSQSGQHYIFIVAPGVTDANEGVVPVTFATVADVTLSYNVEANYYAGISYAKGLFVSDSSWENVVQNDNAYGVDLMVQQSTASPDWDAMAVSGTLGTAGVDPTFIPSYFYVKTEPGDDVNPGSTDWYTLAELGPILGAPAGLYEYKMSWVWKLDSITTSVYFRFSLDNGSTWETMTHEAKDINDKYYRYYAFPIHQSDSDKQLIFQCSKELGNDALDMDHCDLAIQRVA